MAGASESLLALRSALLAHEATVACEHVTNSVWEGTYDEMVNQSLTKRDCPAVITSALAEPGRFKEELSQATLSHVTGTSTGADVYFLFPFRNDEGHNERTELYATMTKPAGVWQVTNLCDSTANHANGTRLAPGACLFG